MKQECKNAGSLKDISLYLLYLYIFISLYLKDISLKDRANFDLGNFEVVLLIPSKTATKLLDNTVLNVPINIAKIHCVENVRTAWRVKKNKQTGHYMK